MAMHPAAPHRDRAMQRLQSLWLASTFLLVLVLVTIALVGGGQLRKAARRIDEQAQHVSALRARLDSTDAALRGAQAQLRELQAAVSRNAARPAPTPLSSQPAAPPGVISDPDTIVRAQLEQALRGDDPRNPQLADAALATELVTRAEREGEAARWSGATWARLALLARLLERDDAADAFALRAEQAGVFPRQDLELAARRRIAAREGVEALALARKLAASPRADSESALLLAEASRLTESAADALAALEPLRDPHALPLGDKLRLASLYVWLERWTLLESLLSRIGPVPPDFAAELNFFRAIAALQHSRPAEALALLDALLEERPDDYDLRVWRGAALLQASQPIAARAALEVAEQSPERPAAWYWLGLLETRAGNPDAALRCLQKSVAASPRNAGALEALGTLAINRNDLETAVQNLAAAIAENPARASAHLLLALAQAKAGRRAPAAASLARALELEPSLSETALQMDALTELLTDDELRGATGREPPAP